MMRVAVCGPEPGPICLQGGCGYCGDYDSDHWLTVDELRQVAEDNGWLDDFRYGVGRQWPNYWKKEGRKKFHMAGFKP